MNGFLWFCAGLVVGVIIGAVFVAIVLDAIRLTPKKPYRGSI